MGATEDQTDSPKVRSRWAIVTWSSVMEAISSDVSGKKDPTSRRHTSVWTLAGMAAISALFIYLAQTSVVTPLQSSSFVPYSNGSSNEGSLNAMEAQSLQFVDGFEEQLIVVGGRKLALSDPSVRVASPETESLPQTSRGPGSDVSNGSQNFLPDEKAKASDLPPVDSSVSNAAPPSSIVNENGAGKSSQSSLEQTGNGRRGVVGTSSATEGVQIKTPAASTASKESSPQTSQAADGSRTLSSGKSSQSTNDDPQSKKTLEDSAKSGAEKIPTAHVFISTDERDLRPIFVVINSTLSNARNPDKVDFNLVMPQENEASAREKLLPLFPGVKIDINRGKIDAERIQSMITYKEGTGARRELVSVFNFIPFYLPFISKDLDRIVYLDADVVVVGDIGELAKVDMEGKAAAAVEDCMQMFKTYFDFKQLAQIQVSNDPTKPVMPHFQYDKKTCVFNRGVLLIDVQRWINQNMTETIEWWMKKFQASKEPLYKFGLSQPPFLLALYQRYKKLDRCWNTRGLGRDAFGEKERDFLARIGFGRPPKSPFLSPWADSAKIMHFNGKFKPWRLPRARPPGQKPKALCGERMVDCAEHWWTYMNDETHRLLTPTGEDADKSKPE